MNSLSKLIKVEQSKMEIFFNSTIICTQAIYSGMVMSYKC